MIFVTHSVLRGGGVVCVGGWVECGKESSDEGVGFSLQTRAKGVRREERGEK
jgi:hypothetical protein